MLARIETDRHCSRGAKRILSPMFPWKRIVVAVMVIAGAVFFWRSYLVLTAVFFLTVGTALLARLWRRRQAVRNFRRARQSQGRDLLLVCSNSPIWQGYVEANWLPRWGHRAVVLNWSERQSWQRACRTEVSLFHAFSGDREFNPLGIVVPQRGHTAQVVRFWRAFREYKHGKDRLLRVAEAELQACLDALGECG